VRVAGVSWWCLGLRRASHGRGVAEAVGAGFCHGPKCLGLATERSRVLLFGIWRAYTLFWACGLTACSFGWWLMAGAGLF
jgi:hypothetical protein